MGQQDQISAHAQLVLVQWRGEDGAEKGLRGSKPEKGSDGSGSSASSASAEAWEPMDISGETGRKLLEGGQCQARGSSWELYSMPRSRSSAKTSPDTGCTQTLSPSASYSDETSVGMSVSDLHASRVCVNCVTTSNPFRLRETSRRQHVDCGNR